MAALSLIQTQALTQRSGRRSRRPQHTFQVRWRPWQIQPIMIAPVLPGETMKRLLVQSRVVTDPIKNPLVGWWLEYYFFYVKHRDLDAREDLTQMVLSPGHDLSALYETASPDYYHFAGTIPWLKLCTKRVVEEWFRDEGEDWDIAEIGNLPSASIMQNSWLDSAVNAADWVEHDVDVDLDADDTIMASEVEQAMLIWSMQREQGLTQMSYEEWCRTYGVRMPDAEEAHRPELIRYLRDWSYPANTVNPEDGSVASAVSWVVAERADKARLFKEPGFIVGYTIVRPKVYLANQVGSAVGAMTDAYSWLPAAMTHEFRHGWVQYAGTVTNDPNPADGPLDNVADDYLFDVRDLFMYGDQFSNFDPGSVTDNNVVALPAATLARRYPAAADADALFVGEANKIKCDGIVSLDIASVLQDVSARLAP